MKKKKEENSGNRDKDRKGGERRGGTKVQQCALRAACINEQRKGCSSRCIRNAATLAQIENRVVVEGGEGAKAAREFEKRATGLRVMN